jgi:hypothetical protein
MMEKRGGTVASEDGARKARTSAALGRSLFLAEAKLAALPGERDSGAIIEMRHILRHLTGIVRALLAEHDPAAIGVADLLLDDAEDAAAAADDGGVREREREAVAIVRAIATMTDEDLLYIPEGYAESFACRLCERWANEQGEALHKPDCLALRARALVAGMEGTNG